MSIDKPLDKTTLNQVEAIIDGFGIDQVLIAIADICGEKAEHIAHNWQDAGLAKRWARAAGAIHTAATRTIGL